jgi:WD40 repeat protein
MGQSFVTEVGFSSVAFSPDGRTLASGSDGSGHGDSPGTIQLWNVTDPARSDHRREAGYCSLALGGLPDRPASDGCDREPNRYDYSYHFL